MTCLQDFTHKRQAKTSSLNRLLVQHTPCRPLLAGACEKFFCVLEVNDVGMVVAMYVVGGYPPTPIDGEGEVKGVDGDPASPN